jgi:hypothetical protein
MMSPLCVAGVFRDDGRRGNVLAAWFDTGIAEAAKAVGDLHSDVTV